MLDGGEIVTFLEGVLNIEFRAQPHIDLKERVAIAGVWMHVGIGLQQRLWVDISELSQVGLSCD